MARPKTKSPYELASNPQAPKKRDLERTPPVNIVLDNLTTEGGKRLQLMTRSNPSLVKAARVSFFYATQIKGDNNKDIGIPYAMEHLEMCERYAIALDGQARRELIDTVKAGGQMPGEFYENDGGGASYSLDD